MSAPPSSSMVQSFQMSEGFIFGKFIEVSLDSHTNTGFDDLPFRQLDGAASTNFVVKATPYTGGSVHTLSLGASIPPAADGQIQFNNFGNTSGGGPTSFSFNYTSGELTTGILQRLQAVLEQHGSVASVSLEGSDLEVEFRPSSTYPGAPSVSAGHGLSPSFTVVKAWAAPAVGTPYDLSVSEIWTNEDALLFVLDTKDPQFEKIQNWNPSLLYTSKFELVATNGYNDEGISIAPRTLGLNEVESRIGGGTALTTTLPFQGEPDLALDFAVGNLGSQDLLLLEPSESQGSPLFITRADSGTVQFLTFSSQSEDSLDPFQLSDLTQEVQDHLQVMNSGASISGVYFEQRLDLPRLDVLADSLGTFNPVVGANSTTEFVVSADSKLVTVNLTQNHNIRSGDFVIIEDSSIATGSQLGGVDYDDAILGFFEVTVTDLDLDSFTFVSNLNFTSVDSKTLSALDTVGSNAIIRFVRPVDEAVLDSMLDTAFSIGTGNINFIEEIKGSTQVASGPTGPAFAPIRVEELNNLSLTTGALRVASNDVIDGTYTIENVPFASSFGLFSGVSHVAGSGVVGVSYLVVGDLLTNTSVQGGPGNDTLWAGATYDPTVNFPGFSHVTGGAGIDTLLLLGEQSDYVIRTPGTTLGVGAYSFDVNAATDVITVSAVTNGFILFNPPSAGDMVYFQPFSPVTLGGQSFGQTDFFEASIDTFEFDGPDWLLTFKLPDVSFTTSGNFQIQPYELNLMYSKTLDLSAVAGANDLYSFPQWTGGTVFVEGKSINSFSDSSDLLSTVVSETRVSLHLVERVQFVSDWPGGPATINLGYLPRNDIKIKQLGTDDSVLTSIPGVGGESNVFRILDATGRSNIVIDSALGEVYDYSAESFGEYSIGSFGGYIVSGSGVAFLGDSDLSEIVIVEGAGKDLNFALSGESFGTDYGDSLFEAGETGGHLNAIAFTEQTHGINIDLSDTDEDGYASFTNNQTGLDELEGLVRGARAVIGSTQDDVITGLLNKASILSGGGGNDSITGGLGDDWIIVGGQSTANGGAGDDTIIDWGASILTGGHGKDTFFVANEYVDNTSTLTHLADFEFAADGASRPGRSSSWEDRVGVSLSVTTLYAMGVFGTSSTAEGGQTLSAGDYQALRNAIDFEVTEASSLTDRVDVVIYTNAGGAYSPSGTKVILASFTVNTSGLDFTEAVNVFVLPDSPLAVGADQFSIPGKMDIFDLFTYQGLDGGGEFDLTNYGSAPGGGLAPVLTEKTIMGSRNDPVVFDTSPQSSFAIADDFVFLMVSMESADANIVRPDFPPDVLPGAPLTLFARNDSGVEIAAKFEGSNANETFVGGALKDEYRFVKETFFRDETTVDPVQSFGRDLIVERNSFRNDTGVRDIIVAKDLDVSDAVFARTQIGREGEVSLSVTWGEGSGLNAGDVSVLRQYSNISSMFRVEDIELSDDGPATTTTTYDLGVTKARGAELHTSDARDAILVGRDNGADIFVVNAGAATGLQDFELHLWGLDESDTLRFEGMGALKSFVAQGSVSNGDYIEHSAVLTFEGVVATDYDWRVNTTFHQDATRDFDFMKLVVDPDGRKDGVVIGENTNPTDLDAENLILFDDNGPTTVADLYEFHLDRQEAMQEAGLSFDGETIDIYLLDGGASSDNNVNLIGFMGETIDEDPTAKTDFVYEERKDAVYDDATLLASSITVVDDATPPVTVATASATFTAPSTEVDITTDTTAVLNSVPTIGKATATLNFVDEALEFVGFFDTASTFSELELATVAAAPS